ncbi:MAG: hypothetical protein NTW10_14010, partial [Bacteroidetes bacterium]|nr:hypothetical protein [Bacteroidota bacterium]
LFLLWSLSIVPGQGQNVFPINHGTVLEMEAVQTPAGTFVTALMENISSVPSGHCVSVYRSADNGATWDSVTRFVNDTSFTFGDPVMTLDSSGIISLVFMGMPQKDKWTESHLQLYQSVDDGLTWQFKGEPYSGSEMADFPQIISSGSAKLHLTYTIYTPDTYINYINSSDGGTTWSNPVTFIYGSGSPVIAFMGCDIGITGNNAYCLAFGDASHNLIYFSISMDAGITWGLLDTIPGIIKSTVNKVISRNGLLPIGIISHQPHTLIKPLFFSVSIDQGATWTTHIISDNASYGEGFLDAGGAFHVIYSNLLDSTEFRLMYTYSDDSGETFKDPVVLHSGTNTVNWLTGEYQSLILAKDNLFHLTFVDGSDSARAKQIIFAPLLSGTMTPAAACKMPGVFPNPFKDVLNVTLPPGSDFRDYELTDRRGILVQSGKLKESQTQLKIPRNDNGMFLLKLISSTRIYICKIIR